VGPVSNSIKATVLSCRKDTSVGHRTHQQDTVGRTWSGLEKDACKRSGLSGRGQRRCAGPDVLWTWTIVKARQLLLFSIDCLTFCLLFL